MSSLIFLSGGNSFVALQYAKVQLFMNLILYDKKTCFCLTLLWFLWLAGIPNILIAQNSKQTHKVDTAFLGRIEARLDQQKSDTAFAFILLMVRAHCRKDMDCLYKTYYAVMIQLERRFNLFGAIFIGQELLKVIAQQNNNLPLEAKVHRDLSRFYSAKGKIRQATLHIEKAEKLFEALDNQSELIRTKTIKLNQSLSSLGLEEVMPAMEALLKDAIMNRDSTNIKWLHVLLLQLFQDAQQYEAMARHVEALEKISTPNPLKSDEYAVAIHAAKGRADLAMVKNDLEEAEHFYQKTLRLCEAEPSRWQEIVVLQSLFELEWKRGNASLAKTYLEKAETKATQLELHELLSHIFKWKAQVAETEGRYADALAFLKKEYFHRGAFEERSAGFDLKNYYLQLEKDQLAIEKRNQELELNLQKVQLRNFLIIIGFTGLITTFFVLAFINQRKGKKALAAQNTLIQQQSERLASLDVAKSRFFANVSHELRTPLSLLLGPVHTLLKENQLTEKQAHLLLMASRSGKQLEQLIKDILDLQKLEMGKMELNEEATELAAFFRLHFAQFESLAEGKGIDFSYDLPVDRAVIARIDQEKCRQILYNLLSNAFKFTPPGGQIETRLWLREDMLHLLVIDTGSGIHPDDLPHVFNRFFQTSRPEKPIEGGTGIGLALCQEYARLFGGEIMVESTPGKRTTFKVAFPITIVESPKAAAGDGRGEVNELEVAPMMSEEFTKTVDEAKPTILVVEDHPELQNYLRLILSEHYNVLTAENGQVAWDYLEKTANCQLILSDLMMPVMDGYQLLEKLKSNDATRHLPVIMLTARADVRDKLKALRIGVDDYIIKPFDEEELLVRLENLLKNQAVRLATIASEVEAVPGTPLMSEEDRIWLETVERYVKENCSSDLLTVPILANQFTMSDSTLLRQLKRLTGLTPLQYLQEMRLDKARQLLENRTYKSIAKVAYEVGYGDTRSFSRIFKSRFGKLPSDFLNN